MKWNLFNAGTDYAPRPNGVLYKVGKAVTVPAIVLVVISICANLNNWVLLLSIALTLLSMILMYIAAVQEKCTRYAKSVLMNMAILVMMIAGLWVLFEKL